jgi:hypothetical protein
MIRAAAAELPQIGLSDALLGVLGDRHSNPKTFERACVRWLGRFCQEAEQVDLADVKTHRRGAECDRAGVGGARSVEQAQRCLRPLPPDDV